MEPTLASTLAALLPRDRVVSHEGVDAPELVIADLARVDPAEVADSYPDVALVGFTSGIDAEGLRLAQAAGFDLVVTKRELLGRAAEVIGGLLGPVE